MPEPSPEPGRHSVLLAEPRLLDAPAMARAIGPLYPELTPIDVRRRCRYAAGILDEGLSAGVAGDLVRALEAGGFGARAVPERDLVALAPPARVERVELGDEGLHLGLVSGRTGPGDVALPWDQIDLVLLHALDGEKVPRRALSADEGASRRALEDTPLSPDAERLAYALARHRAREGRDADLGVDIVRGAEVYRIDRRRIAWRENPASHSLEAYLALAHLVIARAAAARVPRETKAILDGLLDVSRFGFEEELRRYERWLLASTPSRAGAA